jgi:repressor LexA
MTQSEKLKALMQYYSGGKKSAFARYIGVAPSTISSWLSRDTIDYDTIFAKCEKVSASWLISGRGDMVLHDADPSTVVSSGETRPRIPLNAAAGVLTSALDGGTLYQCEQIPVVRAFSRYDFTVLVNGDSMLPQIHSGDELACLNISSSSYIQPGRTYLLDTAQGIVVKVLYDNDDFSFLCHSENPAFSDFTVPRSDVFSLALVIGLLRRF